MELTDLGLQIVNKLKQIEILNNKQIAEILNKDPGNISRKMKQLVDKQLVKKERRSDGKITCNYYSLINDDIDKIQLARGLDTTCKEKVSIPSKDIYDADNINVREIYLSEPNEHISKTSQYYSRQVGLFGDTLRFLEIHDLFIEVSEYLSTELKSRKLTSREARLVKILGQESPNYTWVLDCITLFLSTAQKIKLGDKK